MDKGPRVYGFRYWVEAAMLIFFYVRFGWWDIIFSSSCLLETIERRIKALVTQVPYVRPG